MKYLLNKVKIDDYSGLSSLLKQFFIFGVFGAISTVIYLAFYYLFIYFGLYYMLANIIAFFISVCFVHYWNNRYVFTKTGENNLIPFFKALTSYSITLVLGLTVLYLLVDIFSISEWIAPLIQLCATIPISFLLNKFWVFK